MRKFKLIKEYPGSPKLGYETKFNDNAKDWNTPNMLLVMDCKNYPEFWKEIKEPLFVTEDGVEIFKGDRLFYLNKGNGVRGEYCWHIGMLTDEEYFTENPDSYNFYWFSSKEKLELCWNNLERNKPRFSIKDIEDALKQVSFNSKYDKDMFKQKLGI